MPTPHACPTRLAGHLLHRIATLILISFTGISSVHADNKDSIADSRRVPNIILILVDDLGYGDLSSYGAKDLKSPHIDDLVAQGMRMDYFYANCPVCSPTRASLMTGCYPERVGVPGVIRTHASNSWGWLSPQAQLLPQALKSAGYHTALVGKWHLGLKDGQTPNARGFDYFAGYLGDMMDDYYNHRRHGINYMRRGHKEIDPEGHATDLFTDWACEYIAAQAKEPEPYFLYLAYNAPHTPIQPPRDWLTRVQKRQPDMSERRAKLVALIEHMDAGIGKVVKAIEQSGSQDNTLIIFTSDNGGQTDVGANNGALRGAKQQMYEGGLRVPMCAVWPGEITPGSKSNRLALTMDLFPTVCAAAGIADDTRAIDGRSILPTLRGKQQEPVRKFNFWTRREGGNRYMGKTIWAVRQGDWKLLQDSPMAPFELYNLADDPAEEHNLSQSNRKKYNELATALRAHIQRGGAVPWQQPESGGH